MSRKCMLTVRLKRRMLVALSRKCMLTARLRRRMLVVKVE